METLVKDILKLEKLSSLRRVTKPGGLDNPVTKVGILEYELTPRGRAFATDEHWEKGEFVLTTFQYAKDHPELITSAVKKMCQAGTSGMAIKNVFQTQIPDEAIRYANMHSYPIFLFSDHSLFFEDVIIIVNQLIAGRKNYGYRESVIAEVLFNSCDSRDIERRARIIAPFLSNKYQVAYITGRDFANIPVLQEQALRATDSEAVRYKNGFFLFINQPDRSLPPDYFLRALGIRQDDFFIGISDIFFFRSRLRKGIMQAMFAARFSQLNDLPLSMYKDMGVYQFLFPNQSDPWIEDFYNEYIPVIKEYDIDNNTELFETALLFEKYSGNLKEMAADQNTHINTIRYRLKKIGELFSEDFSNSEFESRLMVALKIYRMRQLCDQVGDLI